MLNKNPEDTRFLWRESSDIFLKCLLADITLLYARTSVFLYVRGLCFHSRLRILLSGSFFLKQKGDAK
jgi:hypothetical protein